jgi:hypothetical protein
VYSILFDNNNIWTFAFLIVREAGLLCKYLPLPVFVPYAYVYVHDLLTFHVQYAHIFFVVQDDIPCSQDNFPGVARKFLLRVTADTFFDIFCSFLLAATTFSWQQRVLYVPRGIVYYALIFLVDESDGILWNVHFLVQDEQGDMRGVVHCLHLYEVHNGVSFAHLFGPGWLRDKHFVVSLCDRDEMHSTNAFLLNERLDFRGNVFFCVGLSLLCGMTDTLLCALGYALCWFRGIVLCAQEFLHDGFHS